MHCSEARSLVQVTIAAKASSCKDWLANLRAIGPDAKLRRHEAWEGGVPTK